MWPAPAGGNGGGTATGVTATEIKVGQIYVATGPVSPSTGQVRGAQAYVNYVNSIGGVYGRKLSLDARDDSLDPTKDASACAALVPTTFALVASQSTAVGACAPLVKSSGIPWVGGVNVSGALLYDLPNVYGAGLSQPGFLAESYFTGLKKAFPDVSKVGIFVPSYIPPAYISEYTSAYTKAGFKVVYSQTFDVTSPNLTPYIIKMRSKGVEAVESVGTTLANAAALAKAMAQQSFTPTFVDTLLSYAQQFGQLAGSAGKGFLAELPTPGYLDNADLLATSKGPLFLAEMQKAYPGVGIDNYTLDGWSNMELFVQALVKAGPNLTRPALISALGTISSFDSGGLLGASNPAAKTGSSCYAMMQFDGSKWARVLPTKLGTYQCS